MRGLGSIFVGLGAFAAVTAAFLLALTLMVSGPPTWSEMRDLSEVSDSAMRDLAAIGRRVAGVFKAPPAPEDVEAPVLETIVATPVPPRVEEKAAPPRRIAKVEPAEPSRRAAKQKSERRRRVEKARSQREARIATPRRAEAAPLEGNPVWLTRELERSEAPSAPRIEPDPEPPPAEAPVHEAEPPLPEEEDVYEGDGRMSEDAYYEELEREAYEREREYNRWRWR